MIQEAVIAAFVLVALERAMGHGVPEWVPPGVRGWAMCLMPFVVLAVMAQAWSWAAVRRLNRGNVEAVSSLERFLLVVRILGLAAHAANCLVLGWPTMVRETIGDQVALDELIAAAPPVAMVLGAWWWFYPIEKRLREAILARQLHEGTPVAPWPSRLAYVWFWARQSLLPVAVPVTLIAVWTEGVQAAWRAWKGAQAESPVVELLQACGVLTMIALGPLLLRRVWRTERLADSPIRERLIEVCRRSKVKVREILLWRTGGTMHNAAVLGLFSPARFILVTDAMLEHLGAGHLEAVAAHEVGHIRKRHLLWLGLSTVASVLVLSVVLGSVSLAVLRWMDARSPFTESEAARAKELADGVSVVVTLVVGLLWFGWVSRRFEWQADAFAAADLARSEGSPETVTQEAASRVSEALGLVAAYNGVAPSRFMWRHGSIRTRQNKLLAIGGKPASGLAIDRVVGRIKLLTVVCLVGFAGLVAYELLVHKE